jgi:YaiO family outer membrane protein
VKSVFGSSAVSFVELRGKDRTWSLTSAGAAFNTSSTGTTTAEVQRATRPGLANVRGILRHDEQISQSTTVYLQASASTGDPLREDWGVGAGLAQRVSPQVQLTLDARAARYRTPGAGGRARTAFTGLAVNPGVVVSPKGTPLELSAQAIVLRNDRKQWQTGGAVRALWYTGDRDFLMLGASRYPENELGQVRQLTSAYAGMRRELGKGFGFRLTAEYARLEGTWTARTVNIGIEKRF